MMFKIFLTICSVALVVVFILGIINGLNDSLISLIICGVAMVLAIFVTVCEWIQPKFIGMK
jgi:hypothetical protein